MKSSTFSLFAVGSILALYAGMAALDATDGSGRQITDQERRNENARIARETCGNANWDMVEVDGKISSLRCIRRKPLNGAKVKQ